MAIFSLQKMELNFKKLISDNIKNSHAIMQLIIVFSSMYLLYQKQVMLKVSVSVLSINVRNGSEKDSKEGVQ